MMMMMMMMMMNCFCGMVDRRKVFSLISSRDHCQRSSPSQISDTPQAGCDGFIGKFLLESQLNNHTINELFCNMLFLLHILNIFPLIVACMEQVFLKMNQSKVHLHDQLVCGLTMY